ncbi:HpcH/HpaI aldolase/citrate lyase family protein [Candidatus Viridilinea mediisalina]|uniref:CoA ester lyase n=1 Tax=Candidatus Viridilinea mediisalina TaxID=2024553 RepID=A0A2A6RIA0_9CHLR|nr:CoA ester lyase [Candidatus Viridilinea mediisalina]PDW02671.1 CoA ester lyase [Candidatus Viridilinea mediisalina]
MLDYPGQADRAVQLERSALFVPASRWPMIEKAARSPADAVIIDLEDAVAPSEKEQARANLVRALRDLDFGPRLRIYRMNSLDTPFAYRDLTEVVEVVGDRVDLILVPKVNSPDDLRFVARLLDQIELGRSQTRPIGLEAQIETANAFLYAREIAAATPRLEALIYGPGDYAAALRAPLASIGERDAHDELYPGHRWHAIMHTIVAAARANGLRCLDGPFAGLRAPEELERASRTARAMGFDGKQCIHPAQIAIVNRVFSPPPKEVAWAEAVMRAYAQAVAQGRGAFNLDGKMIDGANIRMAQIIVEQQRKIQARGE